MQRRVHAFFSGRVQGVGFRYTALDIARETGVTGWVRNVPDGRVELIGEADEDVLRDLLARLQDHFGRYIRDTDLQWQQATGEFAQFSITR